jgi:hypothetical protein
MRKLAFILFTISITSTPASAQAPKCPAGYELIGAYCQSNSTGDVVLPN